MATECVMEVTRTSEGGYRITYGPARVYLDAQEAAVVGEAAGDWLAGYDLGRPARVFDEQDDFAVMIDAVGRMGIDSGRLSVTFNFDPTDLRALAEMEDVAWA